MQKIKSNANHDSADLCNMCLTILDEHKALDIVTINLIGRSSIADYMIIASGNVSRHIIALADRCYEEMKKNKHNCSTPIGTEQGDWVVLDGHDVIIHLFRPEVRDYYNLEAIWQ